MKNKLSLGIALFFVGIVVAGFISYKAVEQSYRSRQIQQQVTQLQQDAQRIQKDNDALSSKIAYLQTPEFQQRVAKDKLNMQLPDENVVVVNQSPKNDQAVESAPSQTVESDDKTPNYVKWWNYFFSIN
jgi:cell division protein FtsL